MSNEIVDDFTPEATGADLTSQVEAETSTAANAPSLGAWFAEARASSDLDLERAARCLMLNPAIIRAIEADDFARLGPPVFARGYLSRYARLLNLPDQEVLERFRQQVAALESLPPLQVVHPLRRETRTRDLRGFVYLVLLVVLGWTTIEHLADFDPGRWFAAWSDDARPGISHTHYPLQSPIGEAVPLSPAPTTGTVTTVATTATAPAASVVFTTPPGPTTTLSVSKTENAAGSESASFAVQTRTTTAPGENGDAKLALEFSNDCWVEIKDAQGNVLTSGLMKANTTHTLSGPAPFKVMLGNAPAARIILDDRLVDTNVYVPRRGTVSRFTLDRE